MSLSVMKNLVQEFGAAIGIPDLVPDEQNRCNLTFDDVAVSFELGGRDDSLCIYSLLGTVPDRDAGSFHTALLHANHLLDSTRGSTLSIDPRNTDVVLIREEQLNTLRLPRLEMLIEDFVNVAEQWMEKLASGKIDEPASTAIQEPTPPDGAMVRV